jgi:hypothetical protein
MDNSHFLSKFTHSIWRRPSKMFKFKCHEHFDTYVKRGHQKAAPFFGASLKRLTQDTMEQELEAAGFKNIVMQREGTNFVVTAVKASI